MHKSSHVFLPKGLNLQYSTFTVCFYIIVTHVLSHTFRSLRITN